MDGERCKVGAALIRRNKAQPGGQAKSVAIKHDKPQSETVSRISPAKQVRDE